MSNENDVLEPVPGISDEEQAAPGDVPEIEDSATSDETEGDTEVEETSEESAAEPPKKAKGVQKRLDELTRQRREAEARAERERQEREYWQRKALGEDNKPAPTTVKPTVEQFTTYEDYLEALTDWKVEQKTVQAREAETRKSQEQVEQERKLSYDQRVANAEAKYDDYQEVAHGAHWSPTRDMAVAIMESEKGPDIAYWLGSHPDDADRIAGLSTTAQIREIGKLEERLSRPAPKPTTAAPPPISPSGAKAKAQKDPSEMTPTEFKAWRAKYIAQRR